ncbi:SPOR domain-containing protein [Fulvimonas sp. R45]|uniref:SPOR domain-containing protein n=1 Tax=Fulvimonas sp. R45 TaxID=3045937 RepID=UPI0026600A2A|nr:SPOR domain-containing protein [Fulvimonas sp. R45]MDO1528420.1 SPOR domain-containing protein [Fulvimonas sp. R45]
MFLRLLFVFLITLNIAVGAWLLLGQDESLGRSATDPGVPELHLLSEQAPAAAPVAAASVAPAKPMAPSASYACMTLGPFATPQDLRSARGLLARELVRARARQEQTTELRGWWVHLPASGSRAQALAEARKLQAKHITDYFVVGSGDQQNTVSLGLFKDPANAHKRLEQVVAAGFPAQLTERSEQVPQYWLDLVVADSAHFDWRSRIPDPSVGSHSSGCF